MALIPRANCGGDALGCSSDCTSGNDMEVWFNPTRWQNSQQQRRSKCMHLCLSVACMLEEQFYRQNSGFFLILVNAVYLPYL